MQNIETRYNIKELFSTSWDVFAKIFVKAILTYLVLCFVPGVLVKAVPNGATTLLGSIASLLYTAIVLFLVHDAIKNENTPFGQILKKIWDAVPAILSVFLIIVAISVPLTILFVIIVGILAAAAGITDPAMMQESPEFMRNMLFVSIPFFLIGIWLFTKFYFYSCIVIFERMTFFKPFAKSWNMTKGNFGRVFLVVLLIMFWGTISFLILQNTALVAGQIITLVLLPVSVYLSAVAITMYFNLLYSQK